VVLGPHSGLSPALLSKLERGKMTIGRISGLPVSRPPWPPEGPARLH